MNHVVAYKLTEDEINPYRGLSHQELLQFVGEKSERLVQGTDGVSYLVTTVMQVIDDDETIKVTVFAAEANWGSKHAYVDSSFYIKRSSF
jgi:hypothetical protein